MKRRDMMTLAASAMLLTPMSFPAVGWAAPSDPAEAKVESQEPKIQLAILLDTSGSMNGLINQARTQIWTIVNEFATATQDGKAPNIEVALYEYGKQTLAQKDGYCRQIVGLTDNLDLISKELFALKTNGGEEYCGYAIDHAAKKLEWSKRSQDLKIIFVCGNEGFNQGPIKPADACKSAISKGINVSTIFCGAQNDKVAGGWKSGAMLADGTFINIDQNQKVARIVTPHDKDLSDLSQKLSKTYVTLGSERKRRELQSLAKGADTAASNAAPAAAAERAKFKAGKNYRQEGDAVDALKADKDLKSVQKEALPAEWKDLSKEEVKEKIKELATKREALQKKIQDLSKKRDAFIVAERKKQADQGKSTLDKAIIKTVRDLAQKKNFKFQEKKDSK